MSFGDVLRRLRENAGLSQQELAERAGLTTHAVSSLERGTRTRPYPHTVRSLGDALGVTDAERAELIASVPRRGAPPVAADRPAGLVIPSTQLFGREPDVAAVVELVREGGRLVTLTGPGGVGKTRLTAAVSDVLCPEFPDGTVQVSLAPLADASALMVTLGRALGLAGVDAPSAFEHVAAHLASSRTLLVLDNFEHLLSAAADVGRLTSLCPGLAVLVSSRSALRVRGEQEYVVEPLTVPDPGSTTVEELAASPAGALVLDRMRAVAAPTALGPDDVRACAELCRRLGGLPLAIELATAHLRLLSPAALLDRLDATMATSGARDLPERQRTMRSTLDWSYGLLDQEQQELFTLLGAFRGGGTLDAVEAVAERPVLEPLRRLVEHSLVVVRDDRFSMLEPVAQYARSLLVGDRATAVHRAHAQVYLTLTEHAAVGYEHAEQVGWLALIEEEEANILVAVERSLDAGDVTTAARITWYMWLYWWLRGQVTVGIRLARRCLATDLPAWERGRVNLTAATMTYAAGDHTAAAAHWAEADRIAADAGDLEVRTKAIAGVGLAALAAGDFDTAEERFRAVLDLADPAEWIASLVEVWLGTSFLVRGEPASAVPAIERGLDSARARGDRLATYVALYNLSQAALGQGELDAARRHVDEGIALSEETRDLANLAYFLETLAVIESAEGRHSRVLELLGRADELRETVGADIYAYYLPDQGLRATAEREARRALA